MGGGDRLVAGELGLLLPCACADLRRASRAVTRLYDDELCFTGLTITRFTLLQVLFRVGGVTQGGLGQILVLDTTTLTRTLQALEVKGWVRWRSGMDRRETAALACRHVNRHATRRRL